MMINPKIGTQDNKINNLQDQISILLSKQSPPYIELYDSTVAGGNFEQTIKNKWSNIPDGICVGQILCGSVLGYLSQKIESGRYGSVVVFSYCSSQITLLRKTNDTWSIQFIS